MGAISPVQLSKIKKWYYRDYLSMRAIALLLGVSLDAVVYFMRHHNLKRRTYSEFNRIVFERKPPSFQKSKTSPAVKELGIIGAMLYWGEGYKNCTTNSVVDFANSDPGMISLFLGFLRKVYNVDEKRLRAYLYCYADQDISALIRFWSLLTGISASRFSKPYVRRDFRKDGRKMQYGLIHIRYGDKKLLLEILRLIEYYKLKYTRR